MEYVAYADESYARAERFRSICSFSFPLDNHDDIDSELTEVLEKSNVSEFKWKKLKSAKYRFCAEKIVKYIINNQPKYNLRIDVLIWDTHDDRHKVKSRDDRANFERMFFHLLKYSMKRRENNSGWSIFPDERVDIDWSTINECLNYVGVEREEIENPLFGNFLSDPHYLVKEFREVQSHECPCCQIADLFAGISVYSKINYKRFAKWRESTNEGYSLFGSNDSIKLTNSEAERFKVLRFLNAACKKRNLGVSLKSEKCLFTYDPTNPINFWHYVPQHESDKAPKKEE